MRVAAQRLANGGVELAVQIETQGQWQPRVLPRTRWLSSRSRVDRWISTSAVNLSSGHELRISARRLESGEVELGLQEILDGKRQERQLPDDRLLPADYAAGEWWTSSPLNLPARLSEPTHVPLLREWTRVNPTLTYNTHFDHNGTITTWTGTQPTTGGEWAAADFAGVLRIGCYSGDNFNIQIQGIAPLDVDSIDVTLTIDDLTFPAQAWNVWTHYEDDEAVNSNINTPDPRRLFRLLRGAKQLSAEIEGFEGTRAWDLSGTLTTPIQDNFEHCANYVVGYIQPPPPPDYVPLVNVNGWLGNVRYQSGTGDDGRVWSDTLTYTDDHEDLFLKIGTSDHGEHFFVLVDQLPPLDVDEVAVVWSIDDGDSVEEQWWVETFEGSHSFVSPHDRTGLYDQLRDASSFTFEVEEADTGSVTFDLTNTFATPVQLNIDERGNWVVGQSREPVYDYVPLTNAGGREAGGLEWRAQTEEDGGISTYVARAIRVDTASASLRLYLSCGSWGGMDVKVNGVPTPTDGTNSAVVTLHIDDGEAFTQTWDLAVYDEFATVFARRDAQVYEQLRGASSITIQVADSSLPATTFDLTGMFDTPVQDNIDNCGMYKSGETRQIEYDYVPVVNVRGQTTGGADYGSNLNDDGTVYTYVVAAQGESGPTMVQFSMSCGSGNLEPGATLGGLPLIEGTQIELSIQIDDAPAVTATWGYHGSEEWRGAWPPDRSAFIQSLRGATSITFTASEHGYGPVTFNIDGFFDTPVQPNIDNCGKWKAGETHEPPPAPQTMSVGQYQGGGPRTLPSTRLDATYPWVDGGRTLGLFMWCGSSGVMLTLSGTWIDGLSGETALVEWSLDGGAVQSGDWPITVNTNGSKNLSPSDARSIIAAWRNGSQLDLTIPGAEPITQQFDLAAIFRQSFVPDFDECLAVPLPTLALPVTNVDRAELGQLTYQAVRRGGSAWPYTIVWLEVPSDDAPEWAGYSSALGASCGIDGIGAQIYGLGLDREVSIDGDTVSVSYSVDGGAANIETWDVWPWAGSRYAISPQDDSAFYTAIKGSDSLTIDVLADVIFTQTYDFAGNGFWTIPVQPNLDACAGS